MSLVQQMNTHTSRPDNFELFSDKCGETLWLFWRLTGNTEHSGRCNDLFPRDFGQFPYGRQSTHNCALSLIDRDFGSMCKNWEFLGPR